MNYRSVYLVTVPAVFGGFDALSTVWLQLDALDGSPF